MLLELSIENYAVIDRIRVRFHPGLNVLTGETGSGKSMVVDALALLLGGRASPEVIRSGETRARVSGIFAADSRLAEILEPSGFVIENGELLIEREILANGKSRAYAGSRPATVALLGDLAPSLGDIHGQHEQQSLFSPEAQLGLLDLFAGVSELLAQVGSLYEQWRAIGRELEELERSEQEKLRLLDLWTFQRHEIEAAAPLAEEDVALENERRVLLNLERVKASAGAAYDALYDSPDAALAKLRAAAKRLEELARIDAALADWRETLRPAEIAIEETAYAVRDYLGRLEVEPGRLEKIESRLATLEKLKRKYGSSVEQVLAFLEQVREQIASAETVGERTSELRQRREKLAQEYTDAAMRLSERRKQAANELRKKTERELASLAMERTTFVVEFSPASWSETGFDAVRFLISPNAGEEPRALEKVASGGELSRIALALKTSVAAPARASPYARTLVFDEVDAGVGGSAAEAIGRRLKKLAACNQVLCVTHLPQIASFADHHYRVEKRELRGRTITTVQELDRSGRVREIGRMLSGQKLTEQALQQAEQLIRMGAG